MLEEGILVFMNNTILEHKKKDGFKKDQAVCFWLSSKVPKKFISYNFVIGTWRLLKKFRLYVALRSNIVGSSAQVVGYFDVVGIHKPPPYHDNNLEWHFHSDSWTEIKDGEYIKPSQGWRYYPKCK